MNKKHSRNESAFFVWRDMIKKTFYDWCIENSKQIYLDNWDYKENIFSPQDVSYGSAYKAQLKCPRGLHNNTAKPLNNITNIRRNNKANYCLKCNSFGQWCLDTNNIEMIDLWDHEKNKTTPFDIGAYSNKDYYFKCKRGLHDSHKHYISPIVHNNSLPNCPSCNSIAQWGIDKYGDNFLDEYWSPKNTISPYEVDHCSRTKVWMKCQECKEDYFVRADHFTSGVRHHGCSLIGGKSKLQHLVEEYIHEQYPNYSLFHESRCSLRPRSPLTNSCLSYDNEIRELNLYIEVMGLQHYEITSWHYKSAEKYNCTAQEIFDKAKYYDEYKMQYVLNHNCYYLAIPYWKEKDGSYKKLIDDKINSIINKLLWRN